MLCLVALTGAAYAYNSTLKVQSNAVAADYLSIDLATGDPEEDIVSIGSGYLVFNDNYAYSGAVKKNTVYADVTTVLAKRYDLVISSDTTYDKIKVSSADIATLLAKTVGTTTVGGLFKIYVGAAADGSDMQELTSAGYAFDVTKTAEDTAKPIYLFVVAMNGETAKTTLGQSTHTIASSEYTVPNDDTKDAKSLRDLFDGADYTFTITFDAYKA
jgi:hypothetical protein